MDPSSALAARLRSLRDTQFPHRKVTQRTLADAFGVVMSSVSSWESGKVPPYARLRMYASFFATERSVADGAPRVLGDDELRPDEKIVRDALLAEFEELLATVSADRPATSRASEERLSGLWRFPGKGRTRIVCGALDRDDRMPFAAAADHNYMQLSSYADLDALVELFGHLRASNPRADVRFELAPRLESDDTKDHLVLLGSGRINAAARTATQLAGLPMRQVGDDGSAPDADPDAMAALSNRVVPRDGEVFQLRDGSDRVFRPYVRQDGSGTDRIVWDLGFFHRSPSPFNADCTLTVCSGVFTRGVYGAVRMFTDKKLREANERHLASVLGEPESFSLLVRVPVFDHATSTPDLRVPTTIVRAWADGEQVV